MGILLHRLLSPLPPLHSVSEQVMVIPEHDALAVRNSLFKILYFIDGTAEMTLDGGERFSLSPGDVVVLPGPCSQRYSRAGASRIGGRLHALIFLFEPPLGRLAAAGEDARFGAYLAETFPRARHLRTRSRFDVWDLATRLRRECDSANRWRMGLCIELVKQFVYCVAELSGLPEGQPPPATKTMVDEACDLLVGDDDGKASCGLERLKADKRFGVLFQRQMGASFSWFSAFVRVERAKIRILSSSQPLSQIAKELSFSSLSTFSRTFRAITGLSPRQYQQQQRDRTVPIRDDQEPFQTHAGLRAASPESSFSGSARAPRGGESPFRLLEGSGEPRIARESLVLCVRGQVETEARQAGAGAVSGSLSSSEETFLLVKARSRLKFNSFGSPRSAPHGLLVVASLEALGFQPPDETRKVLKALKARLRREPGAVLASCARGREVRAFRRYSLVHPPTRHAALFAESLARTMLLEWLRLREAKEAGAPGEASLPVSAHEKHPNHLPVNHAKEYIRKNYARNLKLGEIAWTVGLSEEHLARVFRSTVGETVMGYLKNFRLMRAKELLLRSQKPLATVAEQAGFGSTALFCRAFKDRMGCTPGEYRKAGESR